MKIKFNFTYLVLTLMFIELLAVKTLAYHYTATITFTGTGASTTIDSVTVQNLTKRTKLTVPAGNVLYLTDTPTNLDQLGANDETIHVYPTSADGKHTVSFFARRAGTTQINTYSLDGIKVAGINSNFEEGSNTFELSLPKGIFVIQITGKDYAYTVKILNQTGSYGKPEIVLTREEKPTSSKQRKNKSSTFGVTTMSYDVNDRLLYRAASGDYRTIVTDVPIRIINWNDVSAGNKTTNFNFVACVDADGNNYVVVTIGTQTWMAENLKTTKYNDGTAIPLVKEDKAWGNMVTPGYCWFGAYAATYKDTYGELYNWYTVNTGKLAPTGWHVSTNAEWTTLGDYLTANGYNSDGSTSSDYYAKSLAATTNWDTNSTTFCIGNDLSKNNTTGFSALPGGYRCIGSCWYVLCYEGYWWSSTYSNNGPIYRSLYSSYGELGGGTNEENEGYSIRCVRDN